MALNDVLLLKSGAVTGPNDAVFEVVEACMVENGTQTCLVGFLGKIFFANKGKICEKTVPGSKRLPCFGNCI